MTDANDLARSHITGKSFAWTIKKYALIVRPVKILFSLRFNIINYICICLYVLRRYKYLYLKICIN